MDLASALYGFSAVADARAQAMQAALRVVRSLSVLDTEVQPSPARPAWLRVQAEAGLAAAAREAGGEASLEDILAARMGARSLPRGHVAMTDLNARAGAWRHVSQRKGSPHLRALVTRLVPERGVPDPVLLASRVAAALADCARPDWSWDGEKTLTINAGMPDAVDAGDLALALPYALRRAGHVRRLLPGLTGQPRLLARHGDPLKLLVAWLGSIERQASEASARLRMLERHLISVEARLADVRRPAALRRCVAISLSSWGVWAAQLARVTGVEVSSAWRTLGQAAELGLVAPVPADRRSRGDGTLYAAPPWLRMAGLIGGTRGRPTAVPRTLALEGNDGLAGAVAEMDDVIAAMDDLLARR